MVRWEKVSPRGRTVIITRGHLPTLLIIGQEVTEVPVKAIDASEIKDTNGAGDAFGNEFSFFLSFFFF